MAQCSTAEDIVVRLRRHRPGADASVQADLASKGFLGLLVQLRRVLIQDAAVMYEKRPDHFLFQHPIFQSQAFHDYRAALLDQLSVHVDPIASQIRAAMPLLADSINAMVSAQVIRDVRIEQSLADVNREQKMLTVVSRGLWDIFSGAAPIRIRADLPDLPSSASNPLGTNPSSSAGSSMSSFNHLSLNVPLMTPASTDTTLTSALASETASSLAQRLRTDQRRAPLPLANSYPFFQSTTVDMLWREWHEGLGGQNSFVSWLEMNSKGGHPLWPKSLGEKARSAYRRRKPIVEQLEHMIDVHRYDPADAVMLLDSYRLRLPNTSMDKLAKLVSAAPGRRLSLETLRSLE